MAVFLTVLKVLGIVLLILAGLLLIIMLLVLFVPIRYSFSGSIDDPEGSSEVLHLDLKKDVAFEGSVRWLLGVFYGGLSVGGKDGDDEFIRVEVRILGKKVPLDRFLRKKEPEEEKKEEKPGEPEKKKTLDQKLEEMLNRIEKLYNRLQDVFHVLQSECGTRAREVASEDSPECHAPGIRSDRCAGAGRSGKKCAGFCCSGVFVSDYSGPCCGRNGL